MYEKWSETHSQAHFSQSGYLADPNKKSRLLTWDQWSQDKVVGTVATSNVPHVLTAQVANTDPRRYLPANGYDKTVTSSYTHVSSKKLGDKWE